MLFLYFLWELAMGKAQYEPSANARMMAKSLYDMYMALRLEGFTEEQALSIIATCIHSSNLTRGDD